MAVKKVVYGSRTLIDLTQDNVTSDKMLKGTFAHNASGQIIEGSIEIATDTEINTYFGINQEG